MTTSDLRQFFAERPQLSPYGFAKEVKTISPRLLDYILKGKRTLTLRTQKKIIHTMMKYGYK